MSTYINFIFQVLIPNLSMFFVLRSDFFKLNTTLNTIFISIIQLIEIPVRNHCGSKINLLPYSFVLPFGSKPCWFKPLLFVKSKWACPKSGSGVEWDLCSAADKASSTSASEAVINYGKKNSSNWRIFNSKFHNKSGGATLFSKGCHTHHCIFLVNSFHHTFVITTFSQLFWSSTIYFEN